MEPTIISSIILYHHLGERAFVNKTLKNHLIDFNKDLNVKLIIKLLIGLRGDTNENPKNKKVKTT